jgi:hypothetical protein
LSFQRGQARQFAAALPARERSIALLDELVAESPSKEEYRVKRNDGLWWLAVAQRAQENEAGALATLARIPESNRYYADAAWMRSLILLTATDKGRRDAHEAHRLTKWGAIEPTRPGASQKPAEWQLLLALAQFRTGDAAAAKTTLDNLKNLPADFADILLYVRAMVHWRLGDKDRAMESCRTAVESRRKQPRWSLLEAFHADALTELGVSEADLVKSKDKN